MRFFAAALLVAATVVGTVNSQIDCKECNTRVQNARDAIDNCGDGTDTARDNCVLNSNGTASFISCCNFAAVDVTTINDALTCITDRCISDCIITEVFDYAGCLGGDSSCTQSDCIDMLEDEGDFLEGQVDLAVTGSDAAFECTTPVTGAEPRSLRTCNSGQQCCSSCQQDLADLLHCVYNDILIPWLNANYQSGLQSCDIKEQCGYTTRNRALRSYARALQDGDVGEEYLACGEKLQIEMLAGNATEGVNNFMNCTLANAVSDLPEGSDMASENGASENGESGAAGVAAGVLSAVAALGAAALV